MNKRTLGIIFSLSMFSILMGSNTARAAAQMSDGDIIGALQEAFMMHFEYRGSYRKTFERGYGLGCKKDRDLVMHWSSTLKDLDVSLTPEGTAKFVFNLENSKAFLSYSGNSTLCMYKGYIGDILTKNVRGEFHIVPKTDKSATTIEIKALSLSDLQFKDWTLFQPFVLDVHGDAPKFLSDWVQKSINGLVKTFLKSSFSDKLNRYVSDKVEDALKDRYSGEALQFAQVQDQGLLVH